MMSIGHNTSQIDDDEGRINFSVVLSPKTTRTCNYTIMKSNRLVFFG